MRTVFADSYYYIALVNERDAAHQDAMELSRSYLGRTVTTEWVLAEVADALSAPAQRGVFLELLSQLRSEPGLVIVDASHGGLTCSPSGPTSPGLLPTAFRSWSCRSMASRRR